MTSLLDRLHVTRLDVCLALLFLAAGLVQVVLSPIAGHGLGELFVIGTTLPLAWRRTHPVESSTIASALWLVPLDGFPIFGFIVVILQFFALGALGSPRAAVALVTLWASVAAVVGTLLGPEAPVAAIGGLLVVVAPVLAGRLVRHLRHQNEALAALTRQLQDERDKVEEAAVGAERGRIAQELHDVVGHEITLIAIQAEAAATALRVSPDRAAAPVEAIRTTAHRALGEIRAVLGVLAPSHGEDTAASGGLAELSRRASAAGIENSLEITGTPWPTHAPASLAVNRIVRECLTNAGRHAPGETIALRVDWQPGEVVVEARNPTGGRTPSAPGRGVTGMRHRAELLGGAFDAGCSDGLFEVRVALPASRGDSR